MTEVRNRIDAPSPNVILQELHIPDDANFGTGTFRVLIKGEAFLHAGRVLESVVATAEVSPRFRLCLEVSLATLEAAVLLGREDGGRPVSDRGFLLSSDMGAASAHEVKVVFRNWRVRSLELDGDPQPDFIPLLPDKLTSFLHAYTEAISNILAAKNNSLALHADIVERVQVLKTSDGFFVAYLPHHESFPGMAGVFGLDMSAYDLNSVCQWLTARMLRVRYPRLGARYEPPTPVADIGLDEELIPGKYGCLLHSEVVAFLKSGTCEAVPTLPFPCVQATPFVNYQQGIARNVVPCRFKLWSPVVYLPGLGVRRLFHFTHADLWWYPEDLDLDTAQASYAAQNDVLAFETVARSVSLFSPDEAQLDVPRHGSEVLERFCSEFERLLDSEGHDEQKIHDWLNEPAHHLFLDSLAPSKVWSKVPFGKTVSDFVVRCTDGRYKLIEIERATLRIFQEKGHEPTAHFNHACNQIRDWQQHVREHVHEVREVRGLTDIYEPGGVVMMGRTKDIDSDESRRRWQHLKSSFEHEVYTYDEISDRVRQLASTLRNLGVSI